MTAELPTGTVTFLFTDVEGSTRLLDELGPERFAAALDEHRRIVREALAAHGGVEVDTQGDAFFCAFGSARAAVACAAVVQARLEPTPIRVRVGLHTGEALVADRHYVGLDVHRAARIGACGHGGQVVLSPSTVALLEPGAFDLTDLGEHRLKDLSAPVRLHQLGDRSFPALKTLFRTNLPVPATPFLGRGGELRDLAERASEPGVRVLTLTGPGGTGKTRLSLQLAAELSGSYLDGVWWVPLAPLRDGALIASALAGVLEVEEASDRSLEESIIDTLSARQALVLLDNCEHVVEHAAALVATLAAGCPDVLLLATSREALAVAGEHVYPVQPLEAAEAVELFHARARSAGARLDEAAMHDVVTALCARLDNLPLAVELAAARTAALPPAALLERLAAGLDLLKGARDADERQRTLRATIAWSYGLLEEPEQRLFRCLGVFVGGASLSAIEEVCNADLEDLLSLVAKSLVRQLEVEGDEPRYWMLETIREYAVGELSVEELAPLRNRHLEWFVGFAADECAALGGAGSGEALARVERDLANLRAALEAALEMGRPDDSAGIGLALSTRHLRRGRYGEAEDVARGALAAEPAALDTAGLQDLLARALRLQGRPDEALAAYRSAERALEAVPDRGPAWWERWLDVELDLASLFYFENDQEALTALVGRLGPLVAEHGNAEQRLELHHVLGQQAYRRERYALSEETEALVRETYRMAAVLDDVSADFTLGFCLLWRGKPDEAEEHLARGREIARERGVAVLETRCLVYGTVARRRQNDVEGVREWLRELESQEELHGYAGLIAANAAWLALRDGDLDSAAARADEAFADWYGRESHGSPFEWTARFPLLGVAIARGEAKQAREHAEAMLDESLQPLLREIAPAVEQAAATGRIEDLRSALEIARAHGYS